MRVCSNIIETPSWASYTIQAFCGVDFGLLKSLWSKVVDRDSAISGLKGRKAHRLLPDSVSDTKLCQETKHPASLQQYQIQMAFIKSTQNPTWYGCLFKNYFQFNTHDRTRGHEYYKKKFDLKQMSGSPVACKKIMNTCKSQRSRFLQVQTLDPFTNNWIAYWGGVWPNSQRLTDKYFSYIQCSSTAFLRVCRTGSHT